MKAAEDSIQKPAKLPEDRSRAGSDRTIMTEATKGSEKPGKRKKIVEVEIPSGPRWRDSKLPKVPKKIQLDDEHSEEEPELPYKQVPEVDHKADQRNKAPAENIPMKPKKHHKDRPQEAKNSGNIPVENKGKQDEKTLAEKAYAIVRPIDKAGTIDKLVDEVWKTRLSPELGDLVRASPKLAEVLRKALTKKRVKPPRINESVGTLNQECAFPYMEDEIEIGIADDALEMDDLPLVDSFYISTQKDNDFDKRVEVGNIIVPDPYLLYLASLGPDESPKPVYVSRDSAKLRAVFPKVNDSAYVESVVDSGSQIISMALREAEKLKLSWDTDLQIYMQSANGQLKKSAGLARNVPFVFGDITVYLQVHIIDQPAYKVLLGRPFDILTESWVRNKPDGGQDILVKDPNTGKRCVVPTRARGTYTAEDEERAELAKGDRPDVPSKGPSKQSDFFEAKPGPSKQSRTVRMESVPDEDDSDYYEESDESESESDDDDEDFHRSPRT